MENEVAKLLKERAAAGTNQTTQAPPTSQEQVLKQSTSNFWGAEPEFAEQAKPAATTGSENPNPETKTEEPGATTAATAKPAAPAGLSEKVLRDSAAVAVATIEMPVKVIGGAALWFQLNRQCKKRFANKEDWDRAIDLAQADLEPEDDREKVLKSKMLRLMRKHEEKEEKLPFSDAERSTMEEGFYQKFKVEQKTMSPDMLIICSITAAMGARVFDVATDW